MLKFNSPLANPDTFDAFTDDAYAEISRLNRVAKQSGLVAPPKPDFVQSVTDAFIDAEREERRIVLPRRGDVVGEEL